MLIEQGKRTRKKNNRKRIVLIAGALAISTLVIILELAPFSPGSFDITYSGIIEFLSTYYSIPLMILLSIYILLMIRSKKNNKEDAALLLLKQTAYYQELGLKIVVYQCDLRSKSLINSLLTLSEWFPFSVVLSPGDKQGYFIFFGKDLQELRIRCHEGYECLKDVFQEAKRLDRNELEAFFTFMGWKRGKATTRLMSDQALKSFTREELEYFLRLLEQKTEELMSDEGIKQFLDEFSVFKDVKYFIFYFNKESVDNKGRGESDVIQPEEKYLFSYSALMREEISSGGKDFDSESQELVEKKLILVEKPFNALNTLLRGFNVETSLDKGFFVGIIKFLDVFTSDRLDTSVETTSIETDEDENIEVTPTQREQLVYPVGNQSRMVHQQHQQEKKGLDGVDPVERESEPLNKLEGQSNPNNLVNSPYEFFSPICSQICSEITRMDETDKRERFCTPNLTYSYNKLFDASFIERMKSLKQYSVQKLVEGVISECPNCSFSQVTCLFNVLCYSNSSPNLFKEEEITQIKRLLSSFLNSKQSEGNEFSGNINAKEIKSAPLG
jgi:hypothetical protein